METIHTHTHIYTYICMYVYVYIYVCMYMREKGRKRERERELETSMWKRNINWLPSICALTRNWAHDLGICPDWESNLQLLVYGMTLQSTEPLNQGWQCYLLPYYIWQLLYFMILLRLIMALFAFPRKQHPWQKYHATGYITKSPTQD